MLVRGGHQEELIVATDMARGDQLAFRHDGPAARDVTQDVAGERSLTSLDPVDEWGR